MSTAKPGAAGLDLAGSKPEVKPSTPHAGPDESARLAAWYLCSSRARAVWLLPMWGSVVIFVLILMLRQTFYDARAALQESHRAVVALQPPPVPDAENAALVHASVVIVRFAGPNSLQPGSIICRDGRLLERPEIVQYIQSNAAQLKLIHQAAALPRCNWNLDYSKGFALALPYLSRLRECARLLALEARLKARAGDHAGAARNLGEMLTLADHMETDSVLICGLVATAIRSIALNTMEAILWWDPPTRTADLGAYRLAFDRPIQPRAQYVRAMECERQFGLYTADQIAVKPATLSSLTGLPAPGSDSWLPLFMGAERDCLDRMYREMISNGLEKRSTDNEFLLSLDRNRTGTAVLAGLMVPAVGRVLTQFERVEEHRRLAVVALAFLEHRIANGKDPETLDVLVPPFLPALPVDENSGQTPRMRVDPAGMLSDNPYKTGETLPPRGAGLTRLYFYGENGRDDGGMNTWSEEKVAGDRKPDDDDDPVFRVPPADWKPDGWPTPERLGAPPLPAPSAGGAAAQSDGTAPDARTGVNP